MMRMFSPMIGRNNSFVATNRIANVGGAVLFVLGAGELQ
jgi:hypothetical protein